MYPRKASYRCPPESSDKLPFQTSPKATFISRPSNTLLPSGGSNFAVVPGNNVLKIEPKSLLTLTQVAFKASFFFSSNSFINDSIVDLSFSIISFFSTSSLYSCSALKIEMINENSWKF